MQRQEAQTREMLIKKKLITGVNKPPMVSLTNFLVNCQLKTCKQTCINKVHEVQLDGPETQPKIGAG